MLYRRSVPDVPVTEPHRDPPYHPLASLAKTAYLLVDVWLGWRLRIRPFVRRGGWVIIERGWWDIAVDPLRYRMRQHGRLLWWLGRLLPAPPVAKGDGDGFLGLILAHDIPVELRDDLARREIGETGKCLLGARGGHGET